jgi:hypothetical protein
VYVNTYTYVIKNDTTFKKFEDIYNTNYEKYVNFNLFTYKKYCETIYILFARELVSSKIRCKKY